MGDEATDSPRDAQRDTCLPGIYELNGGECLRPDHPTEHSSCNPIPTAGSVVFYGPQGWRTAGP